MSFERLFQQFGVRVLKNLCRSIFFSRRTGCMDSVLKPGRSEKSRMTVISSVPLLAVRSANSSCHVHLEDPHPRSPAAVSYGIVQVTGDCAECLENASDIPTVRHLAGVCEWSILRSPFHSSFHPGICLPAQENEARSHREEAHGHWLISEKLQTVKQVDFGCWVEIVQKIFPLATSNRWRKSPYFKQTLTYSAELYVVHSTIIRITGSTPSRFALIVR